MAKKRSPASPLAGDLVTEVFDGLADLSICLSYFLLHSTFCALHAAARFEVTIASQLTKFGFRRALDLLRLASDFIFVTHTTLLWKSSRQSPSSDDSSTTSNQLNNQYDHRHDQ